MKFFGRYLRQHRLAILLFILSWGLLAASFALYGLPLAAVAWGFRGRALLEQAGARCIVDTVPELLAVATE